VACFLPGWAKDLLAPLYTLFNVREKIAQQNKTGGKF